MWVARPCRSLAKTLNSACKSTASTSCDKFPPSFRKPSNYKAWKSSNYAALLLEHFQVLKIYNEMNPIPVLRTVTNTVLDLRGSGPYPFLRKARQYKGRVCPKSGISPRPLKPPKRAAHWGTLSVTQPPQRARGALEQHGILGVLADRMEKFLGSSESHESAHVCWVQGDVVQYEASPVHDGDDVREGLDRRDDGVNHGLSETDKRRARSGSSSYAFN